MKELTIGELTREYHRLRAKKVEPGAFDPETSAFGGRKHEVMGELVRRLGSRGTARARVVELMGEPDQHVRDSDDPLWGLVEHDRGEAEALLVYCWRGYHDFAWFGIRREQVVSSGWWFAYE